MNHRITTDDFNNEHHELGGYECHTCNNRAAWIRGIGWKCDNCGQQGYITLIRDKRWTPTTAGQEGGRSLT